MATPDVTRIAGNIGALNALNSLTMINSQLAIHQTRLASGKRINNASDDPAGMSLATTFDVRRQGMQTAIKAIGDAKNLMATMEGALTKVQDILVTMRNKALEAQGSTLGDSEKQAIFAQLKSYRNEINDIVAQTQWNGNSLLGSATSGSTASLTFLTSDDLSAGSASSTTSFFFYQMDVGTVSGSSIQVFQNQSYYASNGSALGMDGLGLVDQMLDVTSTGSTGDVAASHIEAALRVVKGGISQVGAFSARLSFKEDTLNVQYTNTEAAYNRIMNANMAQEQVEASKFMILQQTATAMLAQANSAPQFILSLFR